MDEKTKKIIIISSFILNIVLIIYGITSYNYNRKAMDEFTTDISRLSETNSELGIRGEQLNDRISELTTHNRRLTEQLESIRNTTTSLSNSVGGISETNNRFGELLQEIAENNNISRTTEHNP